MYVQRVFSIREGGCNTLDGVKGRTKSITRAFIEGT